MKIFIDAGHNYSGHNTGAAGNGLREQDITFEVAKRLSDILRKQGIETKLSRPTLETNLGTNNSSSINSRYTMANDWGADYFISIHANAGGGTGAETLYYRDDSLDYARTIQNEYVKKMKVADRGVKYRDNIGVLKYTKMPSILIELGFIDNQTDAAMLKNQQQEMAMAIADGFYKYLGIKPDRSDKMIYNTVEEAPEWARPTLRKLIDRGLLAGTGNKNLDLTMDMIRLLVINDRAGLYN